VGVVFVTVTEPVSDETARIRLGRRQMNFDQDLDCCVEPTFAGFAA
jgi:hypothetical protein